MFKLLYSITTTGPKPKGIEAVSDPRILMVFSQGGTERVAKIAEVIGNELKKHQSSIDVSLAVRAAQLAKADLLTDFHGAINKAVADGKSIGWFKQEFERIVKKNGWEGWTGSDTAA